MKISCKVIEDLLPLYQDHICSDESCRIIEEHLEECEHCSKVLSEMKEDPIPSDVVIKDAAPIKTIGKVWKKSKLKALIKGIIIAVIACAVLFGIYQGLTRWKCIPVSPDLLEVSEVSQLSDGRIVYHLNVKDNKELHFVKFTTNEDGSYYITPMRSVIESKRAMKTGLFNDYYVVDIAEDIAYEQKHGNGIEITSCYLGPEDDGILIWKEGMKLPAASEYLEKTLK